MGTAVLRAKPSYFALSRQLRGNLKSDRVEKVERSFQPDVYGEKSRGKSKSCHLSSLLRFTSDVMYDLRGRKAERDDPEHMRELLGYLCREAAGEVMWVADSLPGLLVQLKAHASSSPSFRPHFNSKIRKKMSFDSRVQKYQADTVIAQRILGVEVSCR